MLLCYGCFTAKRSRKNFFKRGRLQNEKVVLDDRIDFIHPCFGGVWGFWAGRATSGRNTAFPARFNGRVDADNWVMDNGDTKSLYWAGTFVPPTDTTEPYIWDSQNDTEQTGMAILASGDDTKAFTYSDGFISYEVSALGTTTTVRLSKS